ncbi:hypothetical protein JAAARDRAFT_194606 [Jaapia argillacea MUCL 33604]|uniref:Protein kinase domain-containing protein n=1 Tax=Jaapia argillacea MUCL 33604 TaxID=933084 RepID=A0A067PPB3_9AGAM|nr:hypothetical protein JAAARDRAFT_194606 [Jaapia argillacea MUCL 33604]
MSTAYLYYLCANSLSLPSQLIKIEDENVQLHELQERIAKQLNDARIPANAEWLSLKETASTKLKQPLTYGEALPTQDLKKIATPLPPHKIVKPYLADDSDNIVYVVVESRDLGTAEARDVLAELNQCETVIHCFLDLTPHPPPEAFKSISLFGRQGPVPSAAAKSSEYRGIQAKDTRSKLFDGRFAENAPQSTTAPPIQLFNPAFAHFSSKAFDPNYEVPEDVVRDTCILMNQLAAIHETEYERRYIVQRDLGKVLGFWIDTDQNHDRTQLDGITTTFQGKYRLHLALFEVGNELGDGGSDPSTQVAFSYLRLMSQPENDAVRLTCSCPAFLIAHAGPWMVILGAVLTDKCIVQRLTDFLWFPTHSAHDDHQYIRMARILYALRNSVKLLENWYTDTLSRTSRFDPSQNHPLPHPRFFPTPNTYLHGTETVKFAYQHPLESHPSCVIYLAKTIEDNPCDIVVKFVRRYGHEAHQEVAKCGLAPQLLYFGDIDPTGLSYGGLRMVVMEYVEGETVHEVLKARALPTTFSEQLKAAIDHLHEKDFVFGDLRQPNVMVSKGGKVQLIDFDWAGREGEARYPACISNSVDWPEGVEGLGKILKKHDQVMLEDKRWLNT